MDIKNAITCIKFANGKLESVNEEMTVEQLQDLITEAENLLNEAKESLE